MNVIVEDLIKERGGHYVHVLEVNSVQSIIDIFNTLAQEFEVKYRWQDISEFLKTVNIYPVDCSEEEEEAVYNFTQNSFVDVMFETERNLNWVVSLFAFDDYIISHDILPKDSTVSFITNFDWGLDLTEEQYKRVEDLLSKSIDTKYYTISFSYDVSSYDYWVNIMKENNYFHFSIELKKSFDFNKHPSLEFDHKLDKVITEFFKILNE